MNKLAPLLLALSPLVAEARQPDLSEPVTETAQTIHINTIFHAREHKHEPLRVMYRQVITQEIDSDGDVVMHDFAVLNHEEQILYNHRLRMYEITFPDQGNAFLWRKLSAPMKIETYSMQDSDCRTETDVFEINKNRFPDKKRGRLKKLTPYTR